MSDREKRCLWCGLPKFGEERCVCDSPDYVLMERCGDCGTWRPVDDLHTKMRPGGEVGVCTRGCVGA